MATSNNPLTGDIETNIDNPAMVPDEPNEDLGKPVPLEEPDEPEEDPEDGPLDNDRDDRP